jgi:eukaryotic-like serine/threonine-protein kinase
VPVDLPTSIIDHNPDSAGAGVLAGRLVDEFVQRWAAGERPRAAEYLESHPQLRADAEAAVRLIYEEICLRQEHGLEVDAAAILEHFPQWRSQLEVLLDCHRLFQTTAPTGPPRLPSVGETLGEFRLVAELGHGIQGRVYLATQPSLADRPVVLKVTPCTGREHLSLARLQHTHIVPLYAVHDDLDNDLRTLCMPYFGGITWTEIHAALSTIPLTQRTGRAIIATLDACQARVPLSVPTCGWTRQELTQLSYVDAVCGLGARLADALRYAHERGLVHLDLKPSNVLLAADGEPMLLDFHIAQEPLRPDGPVPEWLGGTPAFMAPEHQAAMTAVSRGRPVPSRVDGRADIYSLGLILYESLGGTVPLHTKGPLPPLNRINPLVSVGLADILAKCVAPDPEQRYASAGDLAMDLRRHTEDLPLRGVRNRSLAERWHKWRRRGQYTRRLVVMTGAVVAAAVAFGLVVWSMAAGDKRAVESQKQMSAQVDLARRDKSALQLHVLADSLRFLYGAPSIAPAATTDLQAKWRAVWDKRHWLLQSHEMQPPTELASRLRADLLDLGIIWADLRFRLARPADLSQAGREALQVLAETETLFGPSVVIDRRRREISARLGLPAVAPAPGPGADRAPHTAWEYCALGRLLLQAGSLEKATGAFEKAIDLRPGEFWPYYYQGRATFGAKHFDKAVSAFGVCIALAPDKAQSYFDRALALTELGQVDRAIQDYTTALRLDPDFAAAALNRGSLYLRGRRYAEALADFQYALARTSNPAPVHYNMALAYDAVNDRAAALASVRRALAINPGYPNAAALYERLRTH